MRAMDASVTVAETREERASIYHGVRCTASHGPEEELPSAPSGSITPKWVRLGDLLLTPSHIQWIWPVAVDSGLLGADGVVLEAEAVPFASSGRMQT